MSISQKSTYVLVAQSSITAKPALLTLVPKILKDLSSLSIAIIKGSLVHEIEREASKCLHAIFKQLLISLLRLILLFFRQLALTHRKSEIWCSLEHARMVRFLADFLKDLNAGSSGANNSNSLALHVKTITNQLAAISK